MMLIPGRLFNYIMSSPSLRRILLSQERYMRLTRRERPYIIWMYRIAGAFFLLAGVQMLSSAFSAV